MALVMVVMRMVMVMKTRQTNINTRMLCGPSYASLTGKTWSPPPMLSQYTDLLG